MTARQVDERDSRHHRYAPGTAEHRADRQIDHADRETEEGQHGHEREQQRWIDLLQSVAHLAPVDQARKGQHCGRGDQGRQEAVSPIALLGCPAHR